MVSRKAVADLQAWYRHPKRKPLILRGARQVGKSTLVREFAKQAGLPLWEVNLERHAGLEAAFTRLDPALILQELSLAVGLPGLGREPGLLFLDEIQQVPAALGALRYFHEERPDLPVIAAGSLLEFTLAAAGFSMPVGRVEYHWLGPLVFEEYLGGAGETDLLATLEAFRPGAPFPDAAHRRLLDRLREFLIIGGMPEAVQAFLDSGDFREAGRVHLSILGTYRDDFGKYARGTELERLRRVFEVLPRLVGNKVRFRQYHPDWTAQQVRHCLELLIRAGLALPVLHTTGHGLPLGAGEDPTVWKAFFLDVGLVGTANGTGSLPLAEFRDGRFLNEGALAEQFVAQELLACQPPDRQARLHYWLREGKSANAEVDFLVAAGRQVIPVEVKSGTAGGLRSLHQYVGTHGPGPAVRLDLNPPAGQDVRTSVMSAAGKREVAYRLESLPLYMAGRLGHSLGKGTLEALRDWFGKNDLDIDLDSLRGR